MLQMINFYGFHLHLAVLYLDVIAEDLRAGLTFVFPCGVGSFQTHDPAVRCAFPGKL